MKVAFLYMSIFCQQQLKNDTNAVGNLLSHLGHRRALSGSVHQPTITQEPLIKVVTVSSSPADVCFLPSFSLKQPVPHTIMLSDVRTVNSSSVQCKTLIK